MRERARGHGSATDGSVRKSMFTTSPGRLLAPCGERP